VRIHTLLLLAAAPLGGCINTDTAVFVDPTLDTPTLTVTSNALGTGMTGAFHLKLHLGARASGPSTVRVGQFDILDAAQSKTIVSALALTSAPTFPVTVQPDSDVDVALTFDTGTKLLDMALGKDLCASAGVVVGGKIEDSLQDTATQVASSVFHASCQ
jgi:hypothetical protein